MKSPHFDLIIIGAGAMGSAAAMQAAERGISVLCLEQFNLVHDQGSSHGETRVIRQAYFEKPDYVPFCKRGVELWRQLEADTGRDLYSTPGVALFLEPGRDGIKEGLLKSSKEHGIPIESLARDEAKSRWPEFDIDESKEVFLEPDAGYLKVEECVRAQIDRAIELGANFKSKQRVTGFDFDDNEIRVQTEQARYTCKKLLVAAGAWNRDLMSEIDLSLNVHRVQFGWFPAQAPSKWDSFKDIPVWLFENGQQLIYGFPATDKRGVKAALHHPGKRVEDLDNIDRTIDPQESEKLGAANSKVFPNLQPIPTESRVCLYTMTPDEDFVIDYHPDNPNIVFAAGFSGHGFKFAPSIGEHTVELLFDKQTTLDGNFLRMRGRVRNSG